MFKQLLFLIKKEFLAIWSDKRSRAVIIAPPLLQLIIFSFAVTFEVKNISIGVLDRDNSSFSQNIERSIKNSTIFTKVYPLKSEEQLGDFIDTQKILLALRIPQNFKKNLDQGLKANLGIVADGRQANNAQIASSYLNNIILGQSLSNSISIRNWYNPNLNNLWWILPNLIAVLSMLIAVILTSLSLARERELGTFEQILVSPIPPMSLMLGKIIPPMIIALAEATFIFIVTIVIYGVPFLGSIWILYFGLISFIFSIVGFGLFVSSISSTQQQGILGAFFIFIPFFLMSGFATPVLNMPTWLQPFTDFVSLKYFLVLIKGVYLKNISLSNALGLIWPMLLLGCGSLGFASWFFRKNIS